MTPGFAPAGDTAGVPVSLSAPERSGAGVPPRCRVVTDSTDGMSPEVISLRLVVSPHPTRSDDAAVAPRASSGIHRNLTAVDRRAGDGCGLSFWWRVAEWDRMGNSLSFEATQHIMRHIENTWHIIGSKLIGLLHPGGHRSMPRGVVATRWMWVLPSTSVSGTRRFLPGRVTP